MRRSEFTDEQIIEAGEQLQAQGRPVTGFGIRQLLGGGNVTRLMNVWIQHKEQANRNSDEPIDLPGEVEGKLSVALNEIGKHLRQVAEGLYRQQKINQDLQEAERLALETEQQEQRRIEVEEAQRVIDRQQDQIDQLEIDLGKTMQALQESREATQTLNLEIGTYRAEQRHAAEHAQQVQQQLAELKAELAGEREEVKRQGKELQSKEIERAQFIERLTGYGEVQAKLEKEQEARRALAQEVAQLKERLAGYLDLQAKHEREQEARRQLEQELARVKAISSRSE